MDKLTNNRTRLYIRLLLRALLLAVCLLLLIFTVPAIFSLFLPFIFAYLIAAALNPLIRKLDTSFGIPQRFSALILVVLICAGLVTLIGWFIYTVISEATSLARNIQSIWNYSMSAMDFMHEELKGFLDFLPNDTEAVLAEIMNNLYRRLQDISKNFLDFMISNTAAITSKLGSAVVSILIFIMASYFITAEYQKISILTKKYLGHTYGHFHMLKSSVKSAVGGYLKAQLLLALLALVTMFLSLTIYGQNYALLIALLLAFIDFLPIVGTSVMLIPWGIIALIGGDAVKCLFLIILAAAFFVIRKFAEPKIVGGQTGLHPLAALISIYLGMKIFGIWGAVMGPIGAMILISIIKAGVFDNTIKDIQDAIGDIASILRRED